MRVLLWMPSGHDVPGGHRVQLDQTAAHLNELGVHADISSQDAAPSVLASYDVVHGFGLTIQQIRQCKNAGAKVALSTIYWSKDYTAGLSQPLTFAVAMRRIRLGVSLSLSAWRGDHIRKCDAMTQEKQNTRTAYEMADILLPNSRMESAQIVADLAVTTPMRVVPNAVDDRQFSLPTDGSAREGVVYAGRFEPHKNQLGLMEAMRQSSVKVTLVGPPHPHHPKYYRRCLNRVTDNIRIEPGVAHEKLAAVFQRARVYVLPSRFETTGLVSLEAALAGCNIVTTNRGYAKEYFEDLAWYCDPADPASIRQAVQEALNTPYREKLRERILANYTWKHTAAATLEAYRVILSGKKEGV